MVKGWGMVKGGKRDVCCLRVEERSMGMVNIDSLIKAKQFKGVHKILNGKNVIEYSSNKYFASCWYVLKVQILLSQILVNLIIK